MMLIRWINRMAATLGETIKIYSFIKRKAHQSLEDFLLYFIFYH